jgi:hypothetical protein
MGWMLVQKWRVGEEQGASSCLWAGWQQVGS